MTELPSELYGEKIPVPEEATGIHKQIVAKLTCLEKSNFSSCLDPRFRAIFNDVLKLFERYQKLVLEHSKIICTCNKGCCSCCFHWVEDVNSFEAEIIADFIRVNMPDRIPHIINSCIEDQAELERLYVLVQKRLAREQDEAIDEIDLLLSVFYQARRLCPLCDTDGLCMVYQVRPLTCRVYMSFSDPGHCDPSYINDEYIPTYLLNLEETANDILDRLHFKYQKFRGDTGLRSLLIKYLRGREGTD
jgi:Fe-S-cluster containining protein